MTLLHIFSEILGKADEVLELLQNKQVNFEKAREIILSHREELINI